MMVVMMMAMVAVMVVVIGRAMSVPVVVIVVAIPPRVALEKEEEAEPRDGEPGERSEPWIEPLGHHVAGRVQRHPSEQVHPGRMRCGHDEAEQHRMARGPARSHEIGGHDRLAVARLERMEGAEGCRHEGGEDDEAGA